MQRAATSDNNPQRTKTTNNDQQLATVTQD